MPNRVNLPHLPNKECLITTHDEIRAAFVAQALEKSRIASPYIQEARQLQAAASVARTARGLLDINGIRPALLTAAGVSDKSTQNIPVEAQTDAINGLIREYLEPAGDNFVEELVFRFLLTCGGTISGSMNNIVGNWARQRISSAIMGSLRNSNIPFYWYDRETKIWSESPNTNREDANIITRVKGISWIRNGQNRTLIFDIKVPIVDKNVDINLINCSRTELQRAKKTPNLYLALGELKGGIDPAGADERWKTTKSALNDIRSKFAREEAFPAICFIAAAISNRMADEIWERLQNETLKNTANLTDTRQLASICNWLSNL
ncbi:MAG: AvaI/BsoBI family type II restriction endonuclease [Nanoarchaeota archaeon]|nr:AvaI/BsoBI family type II restriction endonuclease [Nanoarchaeota archaeon]